MPIDLSTEKARRQYHSQVLKIMAKLERTVERQLKPLINRQYMDAASLITHGVTDVDHVVNQQTLRLRNILRVHYRRVAFTAGRQAVRAFDPAKSMNESFWNDINQYIALNTGRKITQMQNTTKKMMGIVIQTGVQAGQTNREIATRLRNTGKVDSKFRAIRIARTETLGLYNSATDASVRETGLKFIRVWSTTKDLRTRRRKKKSNFDHWVVDGQKRPQNEPFDVSGENLDYPGDPKGSAGNIINCRCVLMYERDRQGQRPVSEPGLKPVSSVLPVIPTSLEDDILAGERQHRNNKIEVAQVFDPKTGARIFEKAGTENSVSFTNDEVKLFKGNIFTHNHPSDQGFSDLDVINGHAWGLQEMRAFGQKNKSSIKYNFKKIPSTEALEIAYNNAAEDIRIKLNGRLFHNEITEKAADKIHAFEVMELLSKRKPDWFIYKKSKW